MSCITEGIVYDFKTYGVILQFYGKVCCHISIVQIFRSWRVVFSNDLSHNQDSVISLALPLAGELNSSLPFSLRSLSFISSSFLPFLCIISSFLSFFSSHLSSLKSLEIKEQIKKYSVPKCLLCCIKVAPANATSCKIKTIDPFTVIQGKTGQLEAISVQLCFHWCSKKSP